MLACITASLFGGIIVALPLALILCLILYIIRSNGMGLAILAVIGAGGLAAYFGFFNGFDFHRYLPHRNREYRVFTANDGRTIEARVLAVEGGRVRIERRDGQIFESPIEIYSQSDQSFIREAERVSANLSAGK